MATNYMKKCAERKSGPGKMGYSCYLNARAAHSSPAFTAPDMKDFDKAYDNTHDVKPKYSMRAKTSFGAQIKEKMCESSDTAGPLDVGKIRYEPPKYSIRARTCKMLQLPGQSTDSVPGPGKYPVPSTTYFDHPCLPMPGRTSMKGPPRFNPNPKDLPGPATYNTSDFYKILPGKPPGFSMRVKPELGGLVAKQWSDKTPGYLDLDPIRKKNPVYSMRKRTCKMLQVPGQSTDLVPGPGQYPVPVTTNFDHPAVKMPGKTRFGKNPRFQDHDPETQRPDIMAKIQAKSG